MRPIARLNIDSEVPKQDQDLARTISKSPLMGDPDLPSLSNIEVERAWSEIDTIGVQAVPSLIRLSHQLGVRVPDAFESGPTDKLFGPPRIDAKTGVLRRRTRIVATIGPACADPKVLAKMIDAGMDVARLNFSHVKSPGEAKVWVDRLKEAMAIAGREIEIMADLRGPKIRVADCEAFAVAAGDPVTIGAGGQIPVSPPSLAADLKVGEHLFINDGRVKIEVVNTDCNPIEGKVLVGGDIGPGNGLNLPDSELSLSLPTDKDLADIAIIDQLGIDLVAVSFVETGADLDAVRAKFAGPVRLIAKVERPKAVENLGSIFEASDGLMVARGDGAVEMGDAQIPVVQRKIHRQGNRLAVPTGTATQMMESMQHGGRPSRSDVSDVARAALEGSDFVMTSGETAMGDDPIAVISKMSKILETTELAIRTGTVDSLD